MKGAWVAVTKNRESITTVLADTSEEARAGIRAQLLRRGRVFYFQRWHEDGELVVQRAKEQHDA